MISDLSALPPRVIEQIAKLAQSEFAREAQKAIRNQQRVADHYDRYRPRAINGLGGQKVALDPLLAWEAGIYFKDGNWMNDPEKVKWYLKHNPAAKVRALGTRIQVGYTGSQESGVRSQKEGISNRRSRTVFAEPRNSQLSTRH